MRSGASDAHGYEVDLVDTGEAALSLGATSVHDAAIVDLGLPGIDGIEVVHGLRGWTTIPIIVLSARHQDSQKILALDAGADDYVTKPFSMGELLARSAPRCGAPSPATRCFRSSRRPTSASISRRSARRTPWARDQADADAVAPRRDPVRNPDRLVSQRQLLEEVWGPSYVNQTNYLRQFMAQLRHKFEPDPAHPRYFLTEPGMGIRFLPTDDDPTDDDDRHAPGRRCESSARLSSSTFTAGSPRTPNARSSVLRLDEREHGGQRHVTSGGDTRRLELGVRDRDVRVESAARRGHRVDRNLRRPGRGRSRPGTPSTRSGPCSGRRRSVPSLFFSYTGLPALSVIGLSSLSVACTGTQYGSLGCRVRIRLAVDRDAGNVADEARVRRARSWSRSCSRDPTRRRRPRAAVEVLRLREVLPDERRADDLALGVLHERAVGLVLEQQPGRRTSCRRRRPA